MKRSSMVKILEDAFWVRMNDRHLLTDEEMYSAILKDLEEAGMHPPKIQTDIYLRSECDFMWVNEWEPES